MQAPKYSILQSSLSTRLDSRAVAADLLWTLWHRLRCLKYYHPCIFHCCQSQTQNSAAYHSLAPSFWYIVPVWICEKHCEPFIFWVIWVCKLVCLPGVTLEKDRETWLPACNFVWFWGACYSASPCHFGRSFVAWYLYHWLASEAFVRGRGSAGRRSSIFKVWRIFLPRILTLSEDWDLLCKKSKDDIRSWAWKTCSQC